MGSGVSSLGSGGVLESDIDLSKLLISIGDTLEAQNGAFISDDNREEKELEVEIEQLADEVGIIKTLQDAIQEGTVISDILQFRIDASMQDSDTLTALVNALDSTVTTTNNNADQEGNISGIQITTLVVNANRISDGMILASPLTRHFPLLQKLSIGGNRLRNILECATCFPSSLVSLDLSFSEHLALTSGSFMCCPQLRRLNLDGCGIVSTIGDASAADRVEGRIANFAELAIVAVTQTVLYGSGGSNGGLGGDEDVAMGCTQGDGDAGEDADVEKDLEKRSSNGNDTISFVKKLTPDIINKYLSDQKQSVFAGLVNLSYLSLKENPLGSVEDCEGLKWFGTISRTVMVRDSEGNSVNVKIGLEEVCVADTGIADLSQKLDEFKQMLLTSIPSIKRIDGALIGEAAKIAHESVGTVDKSTFAAGSLEAGRASAVGGVDGWGLISDNDPIEKEFLAALNGEKDSSVVA